MRKSFALCEAFGLTPFPRAAPRGVAEGHSPPGLDDQAADTAVSGGEGEDLKEAGGLRPPASFKTPPLPRLDSLLGTLTRAGGGPPLRYGLLREGKGWGWRTTTAVRHAPVARP
jgi:hypothetical protein